MILKETVGKLVVISGPSAGVGKDTLLRMFLKNHTDWQHPPSTTTRKPRSGEVPGVDMIFVDKEEFAAMQKQGKFLESDFHAGHWYGTQKEPVTSLLERNKNVILRLDVNGALSVKKLMPKATTIIIVPESMEALEQRIRARNTDSEVVINERLKLAKKEISMKEKFDYCIVNQTGAPERALAEMEKVTGVA